MITGIRGAGTTTLTNYLSKEYAIQKINLK